GTLEEFQSLFPAVKKRQRLSRKHPPEQFEWLPLMRLTQSAYQQIMREIGTKAPELGGILLGPVNESIATHFVLDETGNGSAVSWTFGHNRINELLREYVPLNLDMKGFVHSHPAGASSLSAQDINDFRKPFANGKNEHLAEVWAPIVVANRLIPYLFLR